MAHRKRPCLTARTMSCYACNHTYVLVGVKVAKFSREFSVEFNDLKP